MIQKTTFYKMTGGGNDFILIPDFEEQIPEGTLSELSRKICQRRLSVGADGLILLKPSPTAHFRWLFFNADGSEAEMCGNGGRCAARLAHMLGKAPPVLVFETKVGPVRAEVNGRNVKITLPPPRDMNRGLRIRFSDGELELDFINTGVPHAVIFVDDIEGVDVTRIGRAVRWHEAFKPDGTNVDFVKVHRGELLVRTYERGVEEETLACGTGAIASALIAHLKGLVSSPTRVITRGGEPLTVHYRLQGGFFGEVALEGEVRLVYKGHLEEAI